MNLADALAASKAPRSIPKCGVGVLLADMDDDDRALLQAALDDPAYAHSSIQRALKATGRDLGSTTIGRHRRGDCKCDD